MFLFFLIFLFFVVYWDARILRSKEEGIYKEIFCYTPRQWAVCSALFLLGVLPIYLLRRRRFEKFFKDNALTFWEEPLNPERILSDAFGIILLWSFVVIFWAIVGEGLRLFFPDFGEGMAELILSTAFSFILMVILIYRTTENYPQEKFSRFVAIEKKRRGFWKVAGVPVAAGLVFAYISSLIIFERVIQPKTPLSEMLEAATSSAWMLAFLGMAVVVAPFLEEIIFRGYFFRVMSLVKGKGFAIAAVSLVFGFLHVGQYWGDWAAIAMVTLVGFSLTLVRAWTDTTTASIVMHYVYNTTLTIFPIIFLISSNPVYLEYRMQYGQLDFTGKEKILLQSIEEYPDFADAYNDLAWLYAEEKQNLPQALELVEEALRRDPANEAYLDTKAEVLFQMGRVEEAMAIEKELIKKRPGVEYFREQLEKFEKGN